MYRRAGLAFAATVIVVLALDQASKAYVRANMVLGRSIPVVSDVFSLTHINNKGAAFGLLPGQLGFFIAVALVVLGAIGLIWWRVHPRRWFAVHGLGLIAAGALGNLIDRVAAGQVTDFFEIHGWPVFNVADAALDVGVAILIVWLLFSKEADRAFKGAVVEDSTIDAEAWEQAGEDAS
ncbi:MAG: signal peptidase II [Coriobacteriia bacterium]|nr:signal peptidase II [Coriobacteriia bacterium]